MPSVIPFGMLWNQPERAIRYPLGYIPGNTSKVVRTICTPPADNHCAELALLRFGEDHFANTGLSFGLRYDVDAISGDTGVL
jgi:hypothetical protein